MFKRKCKIILIRHGATIYNEQGRLYDSEDYPPINQKGKIEMDNLAHWLKFKCHHVDKIYTSSSLRAIQSARILSKEYELDYKIIDGLYERKSGLWGGLTFEQIEAKYPDMLEKYHQNPYEYYPEGGETTQQVRARIDKIINELVKENENKTILIITHECVIQSAIASILDVSPESQGKIIIPTGSATQINYYKNWATLAFCSHVPQ
ncbi:MAG: histidine phosphatase family protein [Candidatus Gastranaerophilales bacterium]|nr:histidine phosphatase family protein [Candidatus Gastranaerophilales bacterium]